MKRENTFLLDQVQNQGSDFTAESGEQTKQEVSRVEEQKGSDGGRSAEGDKPDTNFQSIVGEEKIIDLGERELILSELENILRLGNKPQLDSFLGSLSHNNQYVVETILAEVIQDIADKRIPLLPQMQEAVETKLIQLRLFSEPNNTVNNKKEQLTLDDVKCCVEMIKKAVARMNRQRPTDTSDEEDGVFLHNALSVAQYLHVLKRFLRPTYNVLPWNEMEFCLIKYLSSILKPQDTDEIDRLLLDKTTIVNHLVRFVIKLQEIITPSDLEIKVFNPKGKLPGRNTLIKNVVSQNPEFRSLYNHYDILRNIHSFKRINSSIDVAISVNLDQDQELGKIVIQRVLQEIGEYLKNTPDSPNVSDDVHFFLLDSDPKQTKGIITSLRDSLSHVDSLTRKIKLERTKNSEIFEHIQNDLKKIRTETIRILQGKKHDAFRSFLEKIVQGTSIDEINSLNIAGLKNYDFGEQNYFSVQCKELKEFNKILEELELEYCGETPEQDAIFKKIKYIVDSEVSGITNIEKAYENSLRKFIFSFQMPLNSIDQKRAAQEVLNLLESRMNRLNEIVPLLRDLTKYQGEKDTDTLSLKTDKLCSIIQFEINCIHAIEEIKCNLTTDKNEENSFIKNRINDTFSVIEGKLKSEKHKKTFLKEIQDKIKIHESKAKLINYFTKKLSSSTHKKGDEIDCLQLFRELKFGGKKEDKLRKNYEATNFKDCLGLVKEVNDNYGILIKNVKKISVFSVEKYTSSLRKFFSFHKILQSEINKAIDEIVEEKRVEIARFYCERLSLLKRILESEKSGKEIEMAVEMLLLEAMEVLEHSSLLADNKLFLLHDSPVLVGKALRNYLAHGDPLVDIMPFSPRTAIFAHARALVAMGGDLITQRRVLGCPSKPLDILEICKRAEQRERMATGQEGMFQAGKRGTVRDWGSMDADPQGRSR